ncbi:helix-turn-helix transcriptional regulator [uncultured Aquimarina sp.]|uniref:helix-turn-helix domain-containing protein n=1 Tax=uncultured Aquimarina sp. TaxID=575652 RepID=UPI00262EB648|nr:helix-turn-helix transcriptional regulator [uncultured Aquimarina sp.]
MEIGQIIGLLIKKRGLTQLEVAKRIGKSPTSLSHIVKGVHKPNPDTMEKICEVLGVPQGILYFLTVSEKDIPEDKLGMYKILAPSLKEFIVKIFGEESVVFES